MNTGKLYGLGVGPGDPELITMKAVRLLKQADIVAVPDKGSGDKTALQIVRPYVEGKELLYCPTPMIRDKARLDQCHDEIADTICNLLDAGKTVCFITLGDPTIYSTYIYVHKRVAARGYDAELIPGVPSFCAVAAKLGQSLCEGSQRLLIVPASCDLSDSMDIEANKVFMKAGSGILHLQHQLRLSNQLENSSMVENCGMENERIWPHFADVKDNGSYFSVVVAKKEG